MKKRTHLREWWMDHFYHLVFDNHGLCLPRVKLCRWWTILCTTQTEINVQKSTECREHTNLLHPQQLCSPTRATSFCVSESAMLCSSLAGHQPVHKVSVGEGVWGRKKWQSRIVNQVYGIHTRFPFLEIPVTTSRQRVLLLFLYVQSTMGSYFSLLFCWSSVVIQCFSLCTYN